jgi:hypothetical protein
MEESLTQTFNWFNAHPFATLALFIWIFVWKGMALWRAAQLRQRNWFMLLLVVNTLGILEIVYLYFISNKYEVEFIEEK